MAPTKQEAPVLHAPAFVVKLPSVCVMVTLPPLVSANPSMSSTLASEVVNDAGERVVPVLTAAVDGFVPALTAASTPVQPLHSVMPIMKFAPVPVQVMVYVPLPEIVPVWKSPPRIVDVPPPSVSLSRVYVLPVPSPSLHDTAVVRLSFAAKTIRTFPFVGLNPVVQVARPVVHVVELTFVGAEAAAALLFVIDCSICAGHSAQAKRIVRR